MKTENQNRINLHVQCLIKNPSRFSFYLGGIFRELRDTWEGNLIAAGLVWLAIFFTVNTFFPY